MRAVGTPAAGYPWTWSVLTWVPGRQPGPRASCGTRTTLARDLAALVRAIRALPLDGGASKDGRLVDRDEQVRRDIVAVSDEIDAAAVTAIWEHALATAEWDGRRTWVHGDIAPGNLLLIDDRLTGLIDFAGIAVGDPTLDLGVAWNLLPPAARAVFRDELDVDETTWTRGRARALAQALVQLPYYRDTNPVLAANARHVIREVTGRGPADVSDWTTHPALAHHRTHDHAPGKRGGRPGLLSRRPDARSARLTPSPATPPTDSWSAGAKAYLGGRFAPPRTRAGSRRPESPRL